MTETVNHSVAPLVIGSLEVLRCISNPLPAGADIAPAARLFMNPAPGEELGQGPDGMVKAGICLEVIAQTDSGGEFIGVTSMAGITTEADTSSPAARNQLLDSLRDYVVHVLWDFTTVQMRTLASMVMPAGITLPRYTPPMELLYEETEPVETLPADEDTGD